MLTIKNKHCFLSGPAGKFKIPQDDEIPLKLAMIYEGECTDLGPLAAARKFGYSKPTDLGPLAAARKFGYSKPRYFQLRHLLAQRGAAALQSRPRGPKSNYRRTEEIVRQIIRHRFLDPDASVEVIAQKLKQTQHPISIRSLQRVLTDFGLQKKLCALNPKCQRRAPRPLPQPKRL